MDFSDDDDLFPERDIGELNEMGWTYRTFGDTNRYYTTQMLRLLFDDFHIQTVSIYSVDNVYTPREMTPEQIEWLKNWRAWELCPSDPPPWPDRKSDDFKDEGGHRQSLHCERKGIFGTLLDFCLPRRLTGSK
ncbi:hypothetical protein MGG_05421 [Pyricularia oryzae 70-15]|uniref:Uncharacterized protein n=3 Tax=Pyricularia oryzae TaxID=318829 RepID=G4MLD8_PYRO7|nr:uncharacterized protein MGG_05421 [Pyricularia oryzae 70-15]ELQ41603.1 hypothetical protein OOU_Y34scaffold00266g1 [Pyricularia oryzae Y34]KAH8841619.1 hypothetical protein MCOR01_005572 [Pyricularia oryzae]EHA57668.1 hypothetical protein MGG_05421 [Pyricularia oryzae 70-15]KAI6252669.1 hypothetical protein MCOR19_010721 [Pyricularia oryzae]KAI6473517.1 hypothetical protein MCOR18_008246 [Pyricularia oryzae]